jgi:multidrug efflux pump
MASTVATPLERSFGAIAGVTTMSSRSSQGSTRVILAFDLDRDINGAAREVQAAINASRNLLPSGMRSMPTYKKINPSQAPIMVLSLTSDVLQRASCTTWPRPSCRRACPRCRAWARCRSAAVRCRRCASNWNPGAQPVRRGPGRCAQHHRQRQPAPAQGLVEDSERNWQVQANDQLEKAKDYEPLMIRYQNGAALRLKDVAKVSDGVEDRYNSGFFNDDSAVLLVINRQAGANIIETVNRSRRSCRPCRRCCRPASS